MKKMKRKTNLTSEICLGSNEKTQKFEVFFPSTYLSRYYHLCSKHTMEPWQAAISSPYTLTKKDVNTHIEYVET